MQGGALLWCSFSGAENEPRDIHPLQGLPLYGEDATRKVADTDNFSLFWYGGTRHVYIFKNILGRAKRAELVTARCGSFLISFKNIPHEEVFRGCTIIGIFFDSWIAIAIQVNRREKLFERSEFFE